MRVTNVFGIGEQTRHHVSARLAAQLGDHGARVEDVIHEKLLLATDLGPFRRGESTAAGANVSVFALDGRNSCGARAFLRLTAPCRVERM